MAKKIRSATQWKVLRYVHVDELERTLETLSAAKWLVVTIIGSPGNLIVVATRILGREG